MGFVGYFCRIKLNGAWNVKNLNGSIAIQGNVPGEIHTDVMRVGILSDPYYRYNDFESYFFLVFYSIDMNGLVEILGHIHVKLK